jgi:mannose-6-phosphate isomerase class I
MRRKTQQHLIPETKQKTINSYDIYPSHKIVGGKINTGYSSLAKALSKESIIILDGYGGVDWKEVTESLNEGLEKLGLLAHFININRCLYAEKEIKEIIEPFLGGDDPIFGYKTTLKLQDYFEPDKINSISPNKHADINIIYGTGASQCKLEGCLVYFDLPKNELQYRMRAHEICNLGYSTPKPPKQAYKHFYFIDWEILNKAKKALLPHISIIVDQQKPAHPVWTTGEALRKSLTEMSKSHFRVRPWFEPGVWGGQWIKQNIKGLNTEVPNYAWSFEMIVPENGLLLEDEGKLLEVSFDMLMFQEGKNVLGKAFKKFKTEFPIRFDFLDTYEGVNLSLQCHPSSAYIKEKFGENFTQDETYYILDAEDNAHVYLGFQEDMRPEEFRQALEHSYQSKEVLDVEKYVQKFTARKHDLFLIPHGTIHCSGKNNLVLEISATPYLYTFKMYDWQRLDLDGKPRPLNIERAFENLNFERKGNTVQDTLLSKPTVVDSGNDWKKVHLPTHPDHFYTIYRYEFETEVEIDTSGQCHLLMLVEGSCIELEVQGFESHTYAYAETFAIPAVTGSYKLRNPGNTTAKVVISFVKDEAC